MKKPKVKIKVKAEGRKDIWLPEKKSLKRFINSKGLSSIHNFIPTERIIVGADHDVNSVLEDIDRAERLAIFTDKSSNMGHSLALIFKNKLECYDIGEIKKEDLKITRGEQCKT
jgi:hypothetical protein